MNKKGLIAVGAAVVVAILVIVLVLMPNVNRETVKDNEIASGEVVEKEKDLVPSDVQTAEEGNAQTDVKEEANQKATFMFFVTKEDEKNEDLNKALDKLKDEYKDTVEFDIKNVDKDKELLKNFPVEGNTPALIMMKPGGDIVNMLFMTAEYDKLKAAIDSAFVK